MRPQGFNVDPLHSLSLASANKREGRDGVSVGLALPGWFQVPPVVIGDLDLHGSLIRPDDTYPPLVVDANAVLASPVTSQQFQSMGWRHLEVR